jgi:hypothetical protein
LVNEHIPFVFTFNDEELAHLERRYRARIEILRELFPWDDPNFGIDEQWAVFYPRSMRLSRGATPALEVRITNHSPVERTYHLAFHAQAGLELLEPQPSIKIPPRSVGVVECQVRADGDPGRYLVTADVRSDGMDFRRWIEALVEVE